VERIIRYFDWLAYGALLAMLFIAVESVLGRILFDLTGGKINVTLPGGIELGSYALLVLVFASLPRAAISGLISVDLVMGALPRPVRQALERSWDLLLAAFAAIIGWLFGNETMTMYSRGDMSQDLGIPLYLVYGLLTTCSLCIMLTGLWLAISPRGNRAAGGL
jgi:TRAP-type C4-dicarboxylate transport system permease small subunit